MTTVAPVDNTAAAQNTAGGALGAQGPQSLDYDAFLQLLVAQMKNQDPLDPSSETEYVAQLATFSNVEQNIMTNDKLSALLTANALGDAQSLIGRTVATPDGTQGRVNSVQITANGTFALLEGGEVVAVGEGMTIS